MIRYHGTPITPAAAAAHVLSGRHGLVSFARPDQIGLVAEVCQSFILDNGAFTHWMQGTKPDWGGFAEWVHEWIKHPGCDWFFVPDVIDGTEQENRKLLAKFSKMFKPWQMTPVWHLHESIEWLVELSQQYPRVAFGSSGEYSQPKSEKWEQRMNDAFEAICDDEGRPNCGTHGLRMMDPTIFSRYPFSSVDSANIARNMGIDKQWESNTYMRSLPKSSRAVVMADRCESHASASVWVRSREKQYQLLFG